MHIMCIKMERRGGGRMAEGGGEAGGQGGLQPPSPTADGGQRG